MTRSAATLISAHSPTMLRRNTLWCAALLSAVSIAQAEPAKQEIHMYRYTNDKGTLVTSNAITPEYARKGYQVVTPAGVVVATVPPEPTAEERQKIAEDAKNKVTAAQQMEQDKALLLRYNSVNDITYARERRLTEISNQIVLLNSNVTTLKSQIDAENQRAAIFERNGQPVPPTQLAKIADLQKALQVTEDQVVQRRQELADETVRFDKETERLIFLTKNRPKT
ncbi:MAG: hypothetical protein IT470_02555 [Pseudomonadales bacterium]|nr:hypothetical protein [Pseudomonadales bacterium]